jgi:flavin reductase (DIM6/NTAB) family NADH-FMN oxidoreductase RutF
MTCAAAKQCRVENVYSYIGNDLYQGQVTQVVIDNLVVILVKANIYIHDYKH